MRLKDRVAVITASGSGMGRASAQLFAREGAKVVVADIDAARGQETVKLIKQAGGEATFVQVDVSNIADLEKMVKTAVQTYGKLNILYNHAGTPGPGGLEEVDEKSWGKAIDINLRSGFFATKFAAPEMKKAGGGSIIFTSSVSGIVGSALGPVYSAGKGGVVVLVKSLALALGGDNIRVNCICPGATETPMLLEQFWSPDRIRDPEAVKQTYINSLAIKRLAKPEDIAYAALFLASDESSFITGVTLPVDGGYTAR